MLFAEVGLLTHDVPRLSAFYQQVLQVKADCDSDVHQAIQVPGALLTLYNNGEAKGCGNPDVVLAFTVEDVDKEYERLKALGVTILEPPTTRPWGARNLLFSDPDGNTLAFRCFPHPEDVQA